MEQSNQVVPVYCVVKDATILFVVPNLGTRLSALRNMREAIAGGRNIAKAIIMHGEVLRVKVALQCDDEISSLQAKHSAKSAFEAVFGEIELLPAVSQESAFDSAVAYTEGLKQQQQKRVQEKQAEIMALVNSAPALAN